MTQSAQARLDVRGAINSRDMALFAEYARMLMTVHAIFCGLMCLPKTLIAPSAVAGVVAALWIVVRTVRPASFRIYYPAVTLGIGIAVLLWAGMSISDRPPKEGSLFLNSGVFSPFVLLLMLGVVFVGDVVQVTHYVSTDTRLRANSGNFLFRHGLRFLFYGIGGCIALHSVVVPLVQELMLSSGGTINSRFAMDRMTLPQNILFKFTESVSAMLFFVLGTCVGSFLNVVIYRIPARLSVVTQASHCPGCQQEIHGKDNIPLIGWLKLQGRCRNCQNEISSRYPIVELTIGLVFLLLYFAELISGGANLPGRVPNHYAGVLWILFYTKWDLVGLYVFHCFVWCALFSWAMIRRDGHRLPYISVGITLAIVVAAILLQPHLMPLTYNAVQTSKAVYSVENAAASICAGTAAAVLLQVVWALLGSIRWRPNQIEFASWLLIGVALGWQAIVVILVLIVALRLMQLASPLISSEESGVLQNSEGSLRNAWLLLPAVFLLHQCVWCQLASVWTRQ